MNMNKTMTMISVLGLGTALSLGMATTAAASPCEFGGKQHRYERMADKLDLNDEQRQQLKQIHRKARPQMLDLKDAMQDNREALRKLDPKSAQFNSQVAELARQQGELVTQKIIQHNQVRTSVFAILTPEQREMAKKMKRNYSGKRGKHGGRHNRMGS
jgi:Spy/CpxP family protein refolding chaperone